MDALSRLSDLFPQPAEPRKNRWLVAPAYAVSAVLAIAIIGLSYWASLKIERPNDLVAENLKSTEHDFQTGTGEQSTITLPDGSQLTLNTNSAVRTEFSPRRRAITLLRGEVHVKVAHDAERPFDAHAGNRVVRAVGTAFNLELTEHQEVELVVTEGKVLVNAVQPDIRQASASQQSFVREANREGDMMIKAGEQILLGQHNGKAERIEPEELEVKLSWREGNLVFRGESLETAIREIERYTTVEFVILDEELKLIRVAGLFKAGDVEGLLTTLKENFNASYQRIGDEKVLLHSADHEITSYK